MRKQLIRYFKIFSLASIVLFVHCPLSDPSQTDSNDDGANSSIFTNFDVGSWVYDIAIDAVDGKWIATGVGVLYLDDNGTPTKKSDDTWTSFTTADGLANDYVWVIGIDASEKKWFGTYGGGVSYFDDNGTPLNKADDTWTSFKVSDGLVSNYLMSLAFNASGGKWFGTASHEVSYFDDNATPSNKADDTWTSFTKFDGLVDMPIVAIAIDAAGGKWFTSAEGARYLDDNGTPANKSDDEWITFTEADDLGCDNIWDIVIETSGGIWIGGKCGGISGLSYLDDNGTPKNKLDDGWTIFTNIDEVAEIAIDQTGAKWFACGSSATCLNDNGTPNSQMDDSWTTYRYIDGLWCVDIMAVAIDNLGGKWFGGAGGISYCP